MSKLFLKWIGSGGLILATTLVTNCSSQKPENKIDASINNFLNLKKDVTLNGAGASFPRLLYESWFKDINQTYPQLQVDYQSVGSGAAVREFLQETIDFGASDAAMEDEEISKVDRGVLMLPMTANIIAIAYNLTGVNELKLPRQVYTDIFLGKITKWNDARITAANPGVKFPDKDITVMYRSDGGGTTAILTKHLSTISQEWKNSIGEGKAVKWSTGIGNKGSEAHWWLSNYADAEGSIGYIEYRYAQRLDSKVAALENKAGKFIKPSFVSGTKTLEAVNLPENLRTFITDPEGEDSYPIINYTWLLTYKKYDDPAKAKAIEATIEYALTYGQKFASSLGYVPLPANVIKKVAAAADGISSEYKISVTSK